MKRRGLLLGGLAAIGARAGVRGARAESGLRSLAPVHRPDGVWEVLEDCSTPDGALVFRGPGGRVLTLGRFMEGCARPVGRAPYCGLAFGELAYAERDLLAERLLAGGEPDPAAVRDAAPPIDTRLASEEPGRILWTAFVGPPDGDAVMPLTPAGNTRNWHVERVVPELARGSAVVAARREGLLGGALPIVVKQFPLGPGCYWEVIVFAEVSPEHARLVPTWQRMMLVEQGRATRVVYGGSYVPFGPFRAAPDEAAFNGALLRCVDRWHGVLAGTLTPVLPEPDWADFARHAFVKEAMVRRGGVWPRYGVVDRDYEGPEYDGFQDIFTASLLANLEWGRFDQAKAVLDNQFDDFVGDDGLVAMRGPEVGQTGLTLALVARYLELTGDDATVRRHKARVAAMAGVLTALHDQALALPADDPGHGLLHGWSESDACLFPDPSVWWKPYFGNSAFAARGFRDLARVWHRIAPEDGARADDWARRAGALAARTEGALRASIQHDGAPPYVPILPGVRERFRESLARHRYSEQQWAHRVYCEMLQSGILPPDLEAATIDSMRAHGATVMGLVGNLTPPSHAQRDILGFISYGYAQALLRNDRVEEYLLFLYGHRYHAHTRGSWTAAEVAGLRGELALFCLPAQMTVPILLRWALLYEDDRAETLHLAKALPRDWFLSPEGVQVAGIPTCWGRVSYILRYDEATRRIDVDLTLPSAAPRETRLYVRLPSSYRHGAPVEHGSSGTAFAAFGVRIDGTAGGQRKFSIPVARI
ncbi:Tat pathway signal protein [Gluconacetobacter asukensis]|uniref:Tat pathway signal protein n=1 Tax=Gluconacetobacter asukensis TaxID=1017181 RepID=A0A7W4J2P1_9PROT|nr:Tat pathway signal protein [Gluconacetobacter asukensis]MBB2173615.1 Tat pathway signal protein [Gluconacetobacter asukensis]